jgi:hypothetical protein
MKMNLKPKLPTSEIKVLSPSKIQVDYIYNDDYFDYIKRFGFIIFLELILLLSIFLGIYIFEQIESIICMLIVVSIIFSSLNNAERIAMDKLIIKKKNLEIYPINKRSILKQTPINQHIDFKVNILENRVDVEYFNTIIPLYKTASLPILFDGIAAMHDFEFYDSTQLFDKTEVLTYKSKRVKEPNFPSLLIIQKRNSSLKIFDLLNQGNWLEFYFHNNTVKRSNFIPGQSLVILISEIKQIEIIVFKGKYSNRMNKIKIDIAFNVYKDTVLYTKDREPELELTTVRDAKAIYKLLKMSDNLKHIEVELKEF